MRDRVVGPRMALAAFAGSAVAWVVASAVGSITADSAHGLAAVYLPIGVAVALMLRLRDQRWAIAAGIPVGSLIVAAITSGSLSSAALGGCANAVEALVAAAILVRLDAQRFERAADALSLAVAAVASAVVGAGLGTLSAVLTSDRDPASTMQTWLPADAVAIVLLVPLIAVIRFSRAPARSVATYAALFAAAWVLSDAAVRAAEVIGGFGVFLAWYALLMIVLLAGVQLGVTGLGIVQVPAAVAAFSSLGDVPSEEWLVRQGIAFVLGVSLLWAVLALRGTMERRARSEQLARDMFERSPVPTARVRASASHAEGEDGTGPRDFTLTRANPAWSRLLGVEPVTIEGSDLTRFVHPADVHLLGEVFGPEGRVGGDAADLRMVRRGGDPVIVRVVAVHVDVGASQRHGADDEYVVVVDDVTAERQAGRLLEQRARTDSLTGLLNRGAILDEIANRINEAVTHPAIGILFVDLDGFKQVNDTLGHSAGDDVLRAVALRLQAALRPRDLVGRIGGDEFVVVAEVNDEAELPALAVRVAEAVRGSVESRGREVSYGGSVGWSMVLDGDSVDTVISRADAAMYEAKASRAGQVDSSI